jgi:queuine/archaeosine tRNA-ribosyltransferase
MNLRHLYDSPKSARVLELAKGGKRLLTPTYFPAISGAKLRPPVKQLVQFLIEKSYPRILVSGYDLLNMRSEDANEIVKELVNYRGRGSFVFLDSGIFEKFWLGNNTWDFGSYQTIVWRVEPDFYTSFDVLPEPSQPEKEFLESTKDRIVLCKSVSRTSEYVPIVHGVKPEQIISVVKELLSAQPPISKIIAVSERDCGVSLSERAKTISQLREVLDDSGDQIALHILGCGTPLSIALYSYCGADLFDSLDWGRIVIDRNKLRTYDRAYHELLRCECAICSKPSHDPIETILLHNLLFYQDFVLSIQKMVRRGTLRDFVLEHLGIEFLKRLE